MMLAGTSGAGPHLGWGQLGPALGRILRRIQDCLCEWADLEIPLLCRASLQHMRHLKNKPGANYGCFTHYHVLYIKATVHSSLFFWGAAEPRQWGPLLHNVCLWWAQQQLSGMKDSAVLTTACYFVAQTLQMTATVPNTQVCLTWLDSPCAVCS